MRLTADDKKLLRKLVKEHIQQVHKREKNLFVPVITLATEIKYEEFLRNLLKKLK